MANLRELLESKHPIWKAQHEVWRRNERRLRADQAVIEQELQQFIWETKESENYKARQNQAVYPNFELAYLLAIYGHILRDAPRPDEGLALGSLGSVRREDGQKDPSRAEQFFYNVDGTGNDGQQFYAWLQDVAIRAGATGHRWVYVDAAQEAPRFRDQELAGLRPYLTEYSPVSVPNWHVERGQLQWVLIAEAKRNPRFDGGKFVNKADKRHLLLVRQGHDALDGAGHPFSRGGWWRFNDKAELLEDGDWSGTSGEIPFVPVYHMIGRSDDEEYPAMSQSGTNVLGNLSATFMNMFSARGSDAFRAASSMWFLLGVTVDDFEEIRRVWKDGSFVIPIPPTEEGQVPSVESGAAGAVAAEVFKGLLVGIVDEAERQSARQITSTPDSSGRSKMAGFAENKGPLLTLCAQNLQTAINSVLRFVELRWDPTKEPSAEIKLPQEYDLMPVLERLRRYFDAARQSVAHSATLDVSAMIQVAEEAGILSEEDRDKIEKELRESAGEARIRASQARSLDEEITGVLEGTGVGA